MILFETILRDILSIHQVSKFSICSVDNESKSFGTNHSWPLNQKYMNIHRVHNICFDIWCRKDGSEIWVVGWYLNAAKWELYFLFCSTELWGDHTTWSNIDFEKYFIQPAREARGLLLADGTPTGGRGEDFLTGQPDFFTETAVTPERKVEKSFPRWEINRHDKG